MTKDGYSICFNEWALDKDIKNELGLLLIISSLTAEKGFCYASNQYLAELFDTDEAQISKKIAKLIKKGYLEVSYTKRGSEVVSRELRLSKMTTDHCQKTQPTDVKNDKENNINNNITSNKKEKESIKKKIPTLEEVEEYIEEKDLNVDAKTFFDYFEAGNWRDSEGKEVKNWKQKLLTWNKFSRPKQSKVSSGNPFLDLLGGKNSEERRDNNNPWDNESSIPEVLSEYEIV